MSFTDFNLSRQLRNGVSDLGFETPTPIQKESFSVILSGKDVVGIAQTGTGKTLAYLIPLLEEFKFSKELEPRILILVPTRELVIQLVENIEQVAQYITIRVQGVYGGTNIKTQKRNLSEGVDILVATPQRLYDLALSNAVRLNLVKKLVIDEVDVMLDFGYRTQLKNIFEYLPTKRQSLMFSATMTDKIETLIDDYFRSPKKISIAVSGTPLDNIEQRCYAVPNFYTKRNLLNYLLQDIKEFSKVLIFVSSKAVATKLFEEMEESFGSKVSLIHSSKEQNYRMKSIENFESNASRILIATDVIARGMDLDKISHVINFDTPYYPENYMHRIGRTGRAEEEGKSLLFYTQKEVESKLSIEVLMNYEIPLIDFPEEVEVSNQLIPEERDKPKEHKDYQHKVKIVTSGPAFHDKLEKNMKVNQGGSYHRKLAEKYSKPQRRGDKILNMKKKNKKKK